MKSSQAAIDFIEEEEIASWAFYDKRYSHFDWPGGASGPTVGCGYDLGYCTKTEVRQDWDGIIPPADVAMLIVAQGRIGQSAAVFVAHNKNSITIPSAAAKRQFRERELPKWESRLDQALRNTDSLTPDCYGALLSLAYNRGCGGFSSPGTRYSEMRMIKFCMAARAFDKIPTLIRSMKRLWNNGLKDRREREAQLFERGLAVSRIPKPIPSRSGSVLEQASTAGTATGAVVGTSALFLSPPSHVHWVAPLALILSGLITLCVSLHVTRHRRLPKADPDLVLAGG